MAADANRDAGVDLRFDPRFQRGYDPARHGARVRPDPAVPPDPAVRPEVPIPVFEVATGPSDESETVVPDATPDAELNPGDEAPPRNPFRLILLIGSLAAIGGAGLLIWRRIDGNPEGGYAVDTGQIFLQQFSDALLGPLLTGGLLGICLWLALGALRRRDDA